LTDLPGRKRRPADLFRTVEISTHQRCVHRAVAQPEGRPQGSLLHFPTPFVLACAAGGAVRSATSLHHQFRVISFHCACRATLQNGTLIATGSQKLPGCGAKPLPGNSCWYGSAVVIVCSCNVISDHQVRSVTAERAVRATSEVYRCLGCSAACGRCVRTIRHIMDQVLAEQTIALPASPSICASSGPSRSCAPHAPALLSPRAFTAEDGFAAEDGEASESELALAALT
jgi:bacterioferritin-associated ferredoxin